MSKTKEQWESRDRLELERRQKQLDKPEYKGYLWVLCIVIVLVHIIDEMLHFHTLLIPDENKAIIFNDYLKRGQQFPYNEYMKTYLSQYSISKDKVKGTFTKTGEKEQVLGHTCDLLKGKVSASSVKTDLEAWVLPDYKIHDSYRCVVYGMDIDGLALKWAYKTVGKIPLIGEMRSYVQSELVEINARKVTDAEIKVPEGFTIVESTSPFKVLGNLQN